jgi:hypothetical protein
MRPKRSARGQDSMNSETLPDDSVESRRRFLTKGLVAGPLLVTLAARPVQAGLGVANGSLGALGSGDVSGLVDDQLDPLDSGDPDEVGVRPRR